MQLVSIALLVLTFAAVGSAMWLGLLQLAHLSDAPNALTRAIMLGPFCPKDAFTETGWRYHRWGVTAAITGFVLFAVWGFTFGLRQ